MQRRAGARGGRIWPQLVEQDARGDRTAPGRDKSCEELPLAGRQTSDHPAVVTFDVQRAEHFEPYADSLARGRQGAWTTVGA